MSSILYYSNYCENCKSLLNVLTKDANKKDIHYLCIDNRFQKMNATFIKLENGQDIILPPTVTKVPALLLLNKGHHVLFGEEIYKHLTPTSGSVCMQEISKEEPVSYSLGSANCNVMSDSYSYLDQEFSDLSTKGEGGMRQLHNYATLDHNDKINTPPEDYQPDKIGDVSLETLQNNRHNELR